MEPSRPQRLNIIKQIVLTRPGKPKASNIEHDRIQLEWTKPKVIASFNVKYYSVYYHPFKQYACQWMEYETSGTSEETVLVTNLQSETPYYFKVQANYGHGGDGLESEVSDPILTCHKGGIKFKSDIFESHKSVPILPCIPKACHMFGNQIECARYSVKAFTVPFKRQNGQWIEFESQRGDDEILLVSNVPTESQNDYFNCGEACCNDSIGDIHDPLQAISPYKSQRPLYERVPQLKPYGCTKFSNKQHYTYDYSQCDKHCSRHWAEFVAKVTDKNQLISTLQEGATFCIKVDATQFEDGIGDTCDIIHAKRLVRRLLDHDEVKSLSVSHDKSQLVPHKSMEIYFKFSTMSTKQVIEQLTECDHGRRFLAMPCKETHVLKFEVFNQNGIVMLESFVSNHIHANHSMALALPSESLSTTVNMELLYFQPEKRLFKHDLDSTGKKCYIGSTCCHAICHQRVLFMYETETKVRILVSAGKEVECKLTELIAPTQNILAVSDEPESFNSLELKKPSNFLCTLWNDSNISLVQLWIKTNQDCSYIEGDKRVVVALKPSKPKASNVTFDSIQLEWIKPDENIGFCVKHYIVYYASDKAVGCWAECETPAIKEAKQVTNLKEGATYYFKVQAYYGQGIFGLESQISDPIQTIKSFKVQASKVSHDQVKLEWTHCKPLEGTVIHINYYAVYYFRSQKHNSVQLQTKSLSDYLPQQYNGHWTEYKTEIEDETLLVINLQQGTTYYFKVEAYTNNGVILESDVSDPVQTKTLVKVKPAKPRALCVSHDRIQLEWEKPQEDPKFNIIYYLIFYRPQCVNEWIKYGNEVTDCTILVTNLHKKTEYVFKVQAHYDDNSIGLESDISDSIQTTEPYKPRAVRVSHDHVALEWGKPQLSVTLNFQCYVVTVKPWSRRQIKCEICTGSTHDGVLVSNLHEETTYYFQVKAFYESGIQQESYISDPIQTKKFLPVKPGKPIPTLISHDSIQLQWEKPWECTRFHIKCYSVYYSLVRCVEEWIKYDTEAVNNTILVSNLQEQTAYLFKVQAHYDDNGIGLKSDISDSIQTTEPYKPRALRISHDHILLEWVKPQLSAKLNFQCYTIYIKPWSAEQSIKCETVAESNHDLLLVSNLHEETPYYLKVKACYDCGIGQESDISDPIQTIKQVKVQASMVSHDQVKLEWKPTKGTLSNCSIVHYTVYYFHSEIPNSDQSIILPDYVSQLSTFKGKRHDGHWTEYKTGVQNETLLVINLRQETTYYFKVEAYTNDGVILESDVSDPVQTKTLVKVKPGKPRALCVSHDRIQVEWKKPQKVTKFNVMYYSIFYHAQCVNEWIKYDIETTDNTILVTNLHKKTAYVFKVQAHYDDNGIGLKSDISDSIQTTEPYKPRAVRISYDHILLEWIKPQLSATLNFQYYTVSIKQSPRDLEWNTCETGVTDEKVLVPNLTKETTYYFQVKAFYESGIQQESDVSDPIQTNIFVESMEPGKLRVFNITHSSVNLEWTRPEVHWIQDESIVSYIIAYYIIHEKIKLKYEYKATSDHQVHLKLSNLFPNTTYIFKIESQYGCCVGLQSMSDPMTTKPTSEPGIPLPVKVTEQSIELKWNKPIVVAENIISYTISYTSGNECNQMTTNNPERRAVVENLCDRTTYYFKVRPNCSNESGPESDESEPITTKMIIPSKPGRPTAQLPSKDGSNDGIRLTWSKPEIGAHNVTSYTVYYRISITDQCVGQWKNLPSVNINRMQVTEYSKGVTYLFKVKPEYDGGEGIESEPSAPVMEQLTCEDMKSILEIKHIMKAVSKWYPIGCQLGVSIADLDIINADYPNNNHTCFVKMIGAWLKQPEASWDQLITAYENVGHVELAQSIDQEFRKPDTDSESDSDDSKEAEPKFRCPCGDCTLKQFCDLKSCPSLDKRFPYIETKKLNEREKGTLLSKLITETNTIMDEFFELIQVMRSSLKTVNVAKVISFVIDKHTSSSLQAARPTKKIDKNDIHSFDDIADFLQQNNYISFFNHDLVKKLAIKFSPAESELSHKMHEYEEKFKKYCKRSIFEVPKGSVGEMCEGHEKLLFKVTEKLLKTLDSSFKTNSDMSADQARDLQDMIAKTLGLEDRLSLPFLDAKRGCVELAFSVSEVVMDTIKSELSESEPLIFSTETQKSTTDYSSKSKIFSDASTPAAVDSDQSQAMYAHSKLITSDFLNEPSAIKSLPSKSVKLEQKYTMRRKISNLSSIGVHIKCGPPGKPFSTRVTSDSIQLQWTEPEYQGTHQIEYYCVHYKSSANVIGHLKALQTETSESTIVVVRLRQKDSPFTFKVRAVNHIGAGVEGEQSDPIYLLKPPSEMDSTTEDHNKDMKYSLLAMSKQAEPKTKRHTEDTVINVPKDASRYFEPKPEGPIAISVSQTTVRLRWTKPRQHLTSTTVLYKSSKDPPDQWLEQNANHEIILVSHLSEKTTYYFKVRFECETGSSFESNISDPIETLLFVPSSPGKPQAVNITHSSIEIEWKKPEQGAHNVLSYIVYYHPPNTACSTTSTTEERVLVSKLSENTTYYFKIQPLYVSGLGPKSKVSKPIKTKQILPSKPGKPWNSFISHDTIQLMWKKPEVGAHNITSYIVYYYSSNDDQCQSLKATEESLMVTCLLDMTRYYFKVIAECETGYGPESELSEPMTTAMIVPSKPGKPHAKNITSSSIQLEWSKPIQGAHNITSYTIHFHSVNAPTEWIKKKTIKDSITVSHLLENTAYVFMIKPECNAGYGSDSELSEPILTKRLVPTRPGKPTAANITLNSIKLIWTKPEQGAHKITSYTIRYCSTSNPNLWAECEAKSTEESILVTQLLQNTTYLFKVCPECEMVNAPESDISEPIKTKMILYTKPGKPNAYNITCNSTDLVWTKPDANTHIFLSYDVQYHCTNSPINEWIRYEPAPTDERMLVSNLAEKTTYFFKIQAQYEDAIGLESVSDSITTKMVVPTEPGKPTALCVTFDSIKLQWTQPSQGAHNITCYTLSYRSANDHQWKKLKTRNNDVFFVLSSLQEQTTYYVKVRAEYDDGCGIESDTSEAIVTDLMVPSSPGKPIATLSRISCNSVNLEWSKPVCGAHNITSYVIFYRSLCEHPDSWRKEIVSGQTLMATISELKPNTVFVFKVCANCKKGLGPDSELSDHVLTKVSAGQKLKENCLDDECTYSTIESRTECFKGNNATQQIDIEYKFSALKKRQKKIKVYDLPKQETMRNESGDVVRYLVDSGHFSKAKNYKRFSERIFMILGVEYQMHVDKIIDSMANYILGVHWRDEFQFTLNSDTNLSPITMYTFHPVEGSRLSYSVTLISTPVFEDSDDGSEKINDGFERNKVILKKIKDLFFIENKRNVDKIHGIGLLNIDICDKSSEYLIDSLVTLFGEDIIPNIIVLLTIPWFDNEELKLKSVQVFNKPVDNDDLWKQTVSSFQTLFAMLEGMKPKSFSMLRKKLCETEYFLNSTQWYPFFISKFGSMSELNGIEPSIQIKFTSVDDTKPGTDSVKSGPIEPGMSHLFTENLKPHHDRRGYEYLYELHWAACKGNLDNLEHIMKVTQANPMERESVGPDQLEVGNAPIHYAAYHGHLQIVKFFMSDLNCEPGIPGLCGRTPLHCAAQEGHIEVVKYLVGVLKCPILCYDDEKVTPLHLAAKHGNFNVVKYLLLQKQQSGKSNELSKCANGTTALNEAALHGHLEIVQLFVSELGYDSDTRGQFERSLLHDAAQGGHLHIVKFLMEDLKLDPPCLGSDKVTPVHLAAKYGHLDIVQYLVNNCQWNIDSSLKKVQAQGEIKCISLSGYNGHPSTKDCAGRAPVCYAAQEGHLAIVKYLDMCLEKLKCKKIETNFDITSLKLAVKHGRLDVVKYFTNKLGSYCGDYYHSVELAAFYGHYEIVQHFLSESALSWTSDDTLRSATENGQLRIIKYLVKGAECDPSEQLNEYKITPLHVASYYGYTDVAEFLVKEMHCDPLKQTSWGANSLNLAAERGHFEIVQFLSELNPDYINAKDQRQRTPLYEAVRKGHFNIAKYLIEEKNVQPTELFEHKVSLLHVASGKGHVKIVKFLIEKRGCKMYCDKYGNTPIHWAAHCNQADVVKYFLQIRNCPGMNKKGYGNMTPLQQARSQGNTAVVELLTRK